MQVVKQTASRVLNGVEGNRKFNLLHRTKLVAIFSGVELTKNTVHVVMYVR